SGDGRLCPHHRPFPRRPGRTHRARPSRRRSGERLMFGATLLLAMRELRRHLMRSFLTTIGIIIGVAAVITMVALGKGVTASIQEQIASLGSNVLIAFP